MPGDPFQLDMFLKRDIFLRLFRRGRGRPTEPEAVEAAEVAAEAAEAKARELAEAEAAEGALSARLEEVLDGGMPVPAAAMALQACLSEEGCDVEAKAAQLREADLIR